MKLTELEVCIEEIFAQSNKLQIILLDFEKAMRKSGLLFPKPVDELSLSEKVKIATAILTFSDMIKGMR